MSKHTGTLEELKSLVAQANLSGAWSQTTNAHQFKSPENGVLNWYSNTGTIQYQGPAAAKEKLRLALEPLVQSNGEAGTVTPVTTPPRSYPDSTRKEKVFVVHGHDSVAREQLELVLHKLGLDPFILANTGGGGLTLIEALEAEIGPAADQARFGIVLMTPDDVGHSKADGAIKAEPRARQNVVLEMGMLISALKRPKVAILKKGHLEVPSDAQGILYIPFNDHVKETVPKLVDRLRAAGFDLAPEAITKASS